MTEQEWLAAEDPMRMLQILLPARISNRQARLLACACVRRVWWPLLGDERSRRAVEAGEQYADRLINRKGMWWAAGPARDVAHELRRRGETGPVLEAAEAASWVADGNSRDVALGIVQDAARRLEDGRPLADLLRDIVQSPCSREPPVAPLRSVWEHGPVLLLAQAIYCERSFDGLPILADALEEAGCTSSDLLSHLRGPGPHVRGCWAVDLLLGRS